MKKKFSRMTSAMKGGVTNITNKVTAVTTENVTEPETLLKEEAILEENKITVKEIVKGLKKQSKLIEATIVNGRNLAKMFLECGKRIIDDYPSKKKNVFRRRREYYRWIGNSQRKTGKKKAHHNGS
eukprot:TRINITY_DN4142_c0_g1_i1.p1 TRINITY_DN4142_c0_g1~~TRINITY_DN4142_c0_g1_i1.p1  ORF type:complete len:126 (+),score=21.34 TRINITY_DN4142_c0_g1_i1:30-407(+)